jgi:hypothetical protein
MNVPGNRIPDIIDKASALIHILTDKAANEAANCNEHNAPEAKEQYTNGNCDATCYTQKSTGTFLALTTKRIYQRLL